VATEIPGLSYLLDVETGKVAELDHFALAFIERGEIVQGFVQRNNVGTACVRDFTMFQRFRPPFGAIMLLCGAGCS
jgi:hypothetical protein